MRSNAAAISELGGGRYGMNPEPAVQVLLGTYNYGRYIGDFLHSLAAQDCKEWSLVVRDDASTDNTSAILDDWRNRLPGGINTVPGSGGERLGITGNFSRLLAYSTAPYVMLADPDDVWHPNKIGLSLKAIRGLEDRVGVNRPCLVHTDLRVVDGQLNPIAPSHWRRHGLVPDRGRRLSRIILENTVSGSTSIFNRALVQVAGDIPPEARAEDWWIALIAAAFGEIEPIHQATMDYRRHGANDSETILLAEGAARALLAPGTMRRRLRDALDFPLPCARVFLARYRDRLTPEQIAGLEALLRLRGMGPLARRIAVLRHRLLFTSRLRNLGMLILL